MIEQETKRLKLGIIFNFNPSWMGGIIYILNTIEVLNFLDENEKPMIILFYKPELEKFVDRIKYPYFQAVKWDFQSIYKTYLKSWLNRKNLFVKDMLERYDLDGLYPSQDYPVKTRSKTRLVSWYADLQHKHYPEFWTRKKITERALRIKFMLRNTDDLVVSSHAVENDFNNFYHIRKGLKIHIFHFASVMEDFSELQIEEIRLKYKLPEKYYMISNQFHKHKNHKVLLEAMIGLKKKGIQIHLAITGRFPDASHSAYMQELHSLIEQYKLHEQISLLGIIPRNEQLLLMKHSLAVLQPSLFEGWSTVIEDAISLQVPVIASNIPVNLEQLGPEGNYFDPHNPEELSLILENQPPRDINDRFYEDYNERLKKAARSFLEVFS